MPEAVVVTATTPSVDASGKRLETNVASTKLWSEKFEIEMGDLSKKYRAEGKELPTLVQTVLRDINEMLAEVHDTEVEIAKLREQHLEEARQRAHQQTDEGSIVSNDLVEAHERFTEIQGGHQSVVKGYKRVIQESSKVYDKIDEYVAQIDEEINKCQDRYLEEKAMALASKKSVKKVSKPAPKTGAQRLHGYKTGRKRRRTSKMAIQNSTTEKLNLIDEFDDDSSLRFEPVYCLCKEVAYGDMVECSDEGCVYEWFHYECMGLKTAPEGKWMCPECTQRKQLKKEERKRRRGF